MPKKRTSKHQARTKRNQRARPLSAEDAAAYRESAKRLRQIPQRLTLSDEVIGDILDAPDLPLVTRHRGALVEALEKTAWWFRFSLATRDRWSPARHAKRARSFLRDFSFERDAKRLYTAPADIDAQKEQSASELSPRKHSGIMERETGFEPATLSLGS